MYNDENDSDTMKEAKEFIRENVDYLPPKHIAKILLIFDSGDADDLHTKFLQQLIDSEE